MVHVDMRTTNVLIQCVLFAMKYQFNSLETFYILIYVVYFIFTFLLELSKNNCNKHLRFVESMKKLDILINYFQ